MKETPILETEIKTSIQKIETKIKSIKITEDSTFDVTVEEIKLDDNVLKIIDLCKKGKTDLISAIFEKKSGSSDIILQKFPDKYGISLLHIAAENCRIETITWLLENGADPTLRSEKGGNTRPYDFAFDKSSRDEFIKFRKK